LRVHGRFDTNHLPHPSGSHFRVSETNLPIKDARQNPQTLWNSRYTTGYRCVKISAPPDSPASAIPCNSSPRRVLRMSTRTAFAPTFAARSACLVLVLCVLAVLPLKVSAADDAQHLAFFEEKIRPVLVKHCYECHAADSKEVK